MTLFSRRHEQDQDMYRYNIPVEVRNRLFQTIRLCLEHSANRSVNIQSVLQQMRDKIIQRYGTFCCSEYDALKVSDDPVIEHLFTCSDEQVMDFLQMCFETLWHLGGQHTVEALNQVLEEENIGYELTPYSEIETAGAEIFGRYSASAKTVRPQLPKIIRKDERVLHAETVKPCLRALSDERFAAANEELFNAFAEYKQGKYGDAVTDAGAAFESVLKTICTHKGWAFDTNKDTCSKLLDICRAQGLFHPFYKQILEGTATIRNKISDAHGKGPRSDFPATKNLADHMLYTVCNNINLLVSLARLD